MFEKINLEDWKRKEWYEAYMNNLPCSYSTVVNLDITKLYMNKGSMKLYSLLVWAITKSVNEVDEMRYQLLGEELVLFDRVEPSFTSFNKSNETFMQLWTPFDPEIDRFDSSMNQIISEYSSYLGMVPQTDTPENIINISMVPWLDFTSFSLHLPKGEKYLLPIFTIGKMTKDNDAITIPLSIQVNHAVTDGFHVGKFVEILEKNISK